MSHVNLKNAKVTCPCRLEIPVSPLEFKKCPCHYNYFGHVVSVKLPVACRIYEMFVSPCRYKYKAMCRMSNLKTDVSPCRRVDLRCL